MKNGTQSKQRLTLVDNNGEQISRKVSVEDVAVAYDHSKDSTELSSSSPVRDLLENKVLFAVVSVACLTAAVAAGSYAMWLSRRKAAHEALSSVTDLLSTCQSRMTQMDKDLKSLSRAQAG